MRIKAILALLIAALTWAGVACAGPLVRRAGGEVDTQRVFRAAAHIYGLDPDLLAAIAEVESGGDADAVSPKGAIGLMQLMPATAMRFGISEPFDPVSNTLGAARFLSYLRAYRSQSGGSGPHTLTLTEILAAYNAGPGAVDKYGGVPPYRETQDYVRRVLLMYLLGDGHDGLGARIRTATPAAHPAAAKHEDALQQLSEIRRERELAIERAHHSAAGLPVAMGQ
ncbi:MAG: lytic transglycosylase domain-containing protein [Candidatus Binataceae bacterium]